MFIFLLPALIKVLVFELDIFFYFKEVFNVKTRVAFLGIVVFICSFFAYLSRLDVDTIIVDSDQYLIINAILVFVFYFLLGRKEPDFVPLSLFFLVENLFFSYFSSRLFVPTPEKQEFFLLFNMLFQIGLAIFLQKRFKRSMSNFFKSRRKNTLVSSLLILIVCFWIIPSTIIPTRSSIYIN